MGGSTNGEPQNGWFIFFLMDDLGVSPLQETSISEYVINNCG